MVSSKNYTYRQFVSLLKKLGIKKGDLLLVHSSLFPFGGMEGVLPKFLPKKIYEAFREVIGKQGTLLVPSVWEEYARFGKPFDCKRSPVDPLVGLFSSYVAKLPGSVRTYSPLLSLTGIGPLSKDICHSWTASSCGTDSAWEKFYHYDGKMCFMGVRPAHALMFLRFVQFRFGVPYIYNKLFTTPIYENGKRIALTVTCPVRYLNPKYRISEDIVPFEQYLSRKKIVKEASIGHGTIYVLPSAKIIFKEATAKLKVNVYYFLKEAPRFVEGEIPMDGKIGKYVRDEMRFKKRG
jgi:aminoglycoside 3-N-acetyltransferase